MPLRMLHKQVLTTDKAGKDVRDATVGLTTVVTTDGRTPVGVATVGVATPAGTRVATAGGTDGGDGGGVWSSEGWGRG